MQSTTYTTIGNVRECCDHDHRSVVAATECVRRDHRGCQRVGGYSDRRIYARNAEHRTSGRAYLRAEPGRPPANARELDDNETAFYFET